MKNLIIALLACFMVLMGCKQKNNREPGVDSQPVYSEQLPPPSANSQAEIKIIPIEHATTVLEWGDVTIYIDPVGGLKSFEGQKLPDLILITDIHGDHFSLETLEELNTEKAKIIVPQAVADKIPSKFTPQIDVLNNGDSKERSGITVEAIPMYNLREEAKAFHENGRGNGYVLNMGNERFYFSGDTEDIPEMRNLKDIDIAFVCMNLPYTMDVNQASSAVLDFKPAIVYPYHYRGSGGLSDVVAFKKLVNDGDKNIEVRLKDWYPEQ